MVDLVKMEELAKAATPGPWRYQDTSDSYTHIVRYGENGFLVQFPQNPSGGKNARFIAAANPSTVLELIAALTSAKAEIEKLREENAQLAKIKTAIDDCVDDTWECPMCGHSEKWWVESNAHYESAYPYYPGHAAAAIGEKEPRT